MEEWELGDEGIRRERGSFGNGLSCFVGNKVGITSKDIRHNQTFVN